MPRVFLFFSWSRMWLRALLSFLHRAGMVAGKAGRRGTQWGTLWGTLWGTQWPVSLALNRSCFRDGAPPQCLGCACLAGKGEEWQCWAAAPLPAGTAQPVASQGRGNALRSAGAPSLALPRPLLRRRGRRGRGPSKGVPRGVPLEYPWSWSTRGTLYFEPQQHEQKLLPPPALQHFAVRALLLASSSCERRGVAWEWASPWECCWAAPGRLEAVAPLPGGLGILGACA